MINKSLPSSNAGTAEALQAELGPPYADLTASDSDGTVFIRGCFPVVHEGKILDRYQVEIKWSETETEAPILRENGGRIPWLADRHIQPNGNACVLVQEEWLLRPREQRRLIDYLNGPVRAFFLWQSLVERGDPEPWSGRLHGKAGLIQAYGEMLGITDEPVLLRSLEYLARKAGKRQMRCPCGKGELARKCHIEQLRILQQRIPRHIAELALRRITDPFMR